MALFTTWAGITDKPDTFPTANYTHNQITPANTWVIIHNLNKYPAITIVDSGGNTVVGETQYVSENQVKVNFTAAFAGKAYLN